MADRSQVFSSSGALKRNFLRKEQLRRYRRYLYETGAVDSTQIGQRRVIEEKVVGKKRKKEFIISRGDRFRYRTRYFTDSGIVGTKEFVSTTYQRFKTHFNARHAKIPKPIKGLEGVYSLKRLAET